MFRALAMILVMGFVLVDAGCGVRQFGGRLFTNKPAQGQETVAFGPFHASGQGGNAMNTPGCNPLATHPCARARASVGMPYQFDINSNNTQGLTTPGGKTFPQPPVGGYVSVAGPGRAKGAPNDPTVREVTDLENKDLKLMKRGTASGEHVFP